MPFDGSEFVANPVETGARHPGIWAVLRAAASQFRPSAKGLLPTILPSDSPGVGTVQVLSLARSLIEDEQHWIQRRYETLDGRRCAVGALRCATRLMSLRNLNLDAHNLLLEVAIGRGFSDIEKMNDHSTHRQVVSAFDVAIDRAQARM
jgi:hypothetical protein